MKEDYLNEYKIDKDTYWVVKEDFDEIDVSSMPF